ncbi:hypothetical protein [Winslowiella iniecta]|uniref:hypothetical protein n=1 Tax=Winslowiella iniecta TaxID=1560201 RepID=UPI0012E16415|nr:hypothetical protein [Winslowiella iniecta]
MLCVKAARNFHPVAKGKKTQLTVTKITDLRQEKLVTARVFYRSMAQAERSFTQADIYASLLKLSAAKESGSLFTDYPVFRA